MPGNFKREFKTVMGFMNKVQASKAIEVMFPTDKHYRQEILLPPEMKRVYGFQKLGTLISLYFIRI